MRHFQALLLALILHASVSAEPTATREGSVRFLCADPDLPPKYAKRKDGFYSVIPYDFDECPPPAIYKKHAGDYSSCPFNSGGVSLPHRIPRSTAAHEDYYVKDTGSGGTFETPAPNPKSRHPGGDSGPKQETEPKVKQPWRLIAEAPPADGRDYLLCLFQPKSLAKWYPPAVARIDISPATFPAGRCLFVNCSPFQVFVQVGATSKPIAIAPTGGFAVSGENAGAKGSLPVKIAVGNTEVMSVAFNRDMEIPSDRRAVFVITVKRAPEGSPPRANVKYYFLNENPPAPILESDKKSSAVPKSFS